MNILNITTMVGLRGGDVQMFTVYELLKKYQEFNQYILCPDNAQLLLEQGQDDPDFITYKKKNKIISVVPSIIKAVKNKKIDIVHIHDSSALTATLIASCFFPKGVKIILSRKKDKKIKSKFSQRFKYNNPKVQRIISVSKAVESIFHNIITDKSKLITIYDAIDVQAFSKNKNLNKIHNEFNWGDDVKIIGNIAALTNQKDIITFVETAEKILQKYIGNKILKFVVIGDGDKKEDVIELINSKKLQNEIILMGYRNNIQELLPEFDVFLLTSISEGLPLTIYEALACKIPVVATKAGGIPEVITNGETGFISEIKNSDSLSDNVITLLEDEELAKKIKQNGFELVSKSFDLPIMKENYYKFYKSL